MNVNASDATIQPDSANVWTGIQTFADDIALQFGTGGTASLIYETADANANLILLSLPAGGATDVCGFVIGDNTALNKDLALFNGITQPFVAVVDDPATAYLLMGFSANAAPMIKSANAISIVASGDTDDYFQFSVTSGRPLFAPVGSYLVLGADGTPGNATANGDIYIKQAVEVDGILYTDGGLRMPNNVEWIAKYAGGSAKQVMSINTSDVLILGGDCNNIQFWKDTGSGTGSTLILTATNALVGTTTQDSPTFDLRAKYWNGSVTTNWDFEILHDMIATTPQSEVTFQINDVEIMCIENNNGTSGWSVFNTAPAAQQAHIVNADGTLADITTKFNTLLANHYEKFGFGATA